jgi:hypothetical protein
MMVLCIIRLQNTTPMLSRAEDEQRKAEGFSAAEGLLLSECGRLQEI